MADGEKPEQSSSGRARHTGPVCVVVRAETLEGADEDFLTLLTDLAHHVRAEEPGCASYVITRQIGSRQHFAVHVRFRTWQAFEDHAETPHLRRLLPRLTAHLATPVSMEIFLEV